MSVLANKTPRRITHKFYVDDSGTKEYADDRAYSAKGDGKTPFFTYGGLLMPLSEELTLERELLALKRDCFKTTDRIEIKANWLRRKEQREKRYLRKYNIDEQRLTRFVNDVYTLILEANCQLIAAVVDKASVQARYKTPWYAPTISYECLSQRVQIEMDRKDGVAHVTVDTMDGATPGSNQYQDLLEKHHKSLVTNGSKLQAGMKIDRLAGINFANSAYDERLQLADLVAYAVYRQFVDDPQCMRATGTPSYEYLARLLPRFANDGGAKVAGYGIAIFP
jgi:hypothetical protein